MSINRSPSPSLNDDEYCLASNIPFKLNVPLDPLVGLQKHVEEYTKLSNESSSSVKGYGTGDGYLSLERGIIEKMEISLKEQRDFEEGIGSLLEDNEAITKLSRQTYRWMNRSSSATKSIFDSSANNGGSGNGSYNNNSASSNSSSKLNSYGESTFSKSNYSSSTQPTNYSTKISNTRNPPITSISTSNAPSYSACSSTSTSNATATSTTVTPKSETPESKALQLAQTYIPHETKERQDSFTRMYLAINQQQQSPLTAPLTDFEILQAFIKFDSNEKLSIMYLKNMQALKEMGFPSEQIQQTLQHHPFDQEKALEEIFSKM